MKKRILALLLCLSMLFTVLLATACNSKKEPAPTPAPTERTDDSEKSGQPGETPAPEDPVPEDPDPEEPVPEEPDPEEPDPEEPAPEEPENTAELYQKLGQAIQDTLQASGENRPESQLSQALKNAAKNGWIKLSVAGTPAAEAAGPDLYVRIQPHETAGAAELLIGNGEGAIDAAVWYDLSDSVILQSNALLGGTYGANLQLLPFFLLQSIPAEVWENEQLAQVLGVVAAMLSSGNGLDLGALGGFGESGESDAGSMVASLAEELIAVIEEYFTISDSESQVQTTSLGAKINADCLKLTLSKNDLSALLDPLYAALENYDKLKPTLEKVYPYLRQIFGYLKNTSLGESLPEIDLPENLDGLSTLSPEQLSTLLDMAAELLSEVSGDLSVFLNEEGMIVRIEAALRAKEIPITTVLELGENPGEEFALSVKLPLLGDLLSLSNRKTATGRKISFTYNGVFIPNASLLSYSCDLTIPEGYGITSFSQTAIKKGEGYLPEIETKKVSFEYRETDGLQVISGFTLTENGKAAPAPEFEIVICEADETLPEAPEYTDLLFLTEDERAELWEQIKANVAALIPAAEPEDE